MSNTDTFVSINNLTSEERKEYIEAIQYRIKGEFSESQQLVNDHTIKSQVPATIAIRTPDEESKEWVRQTNRALLPQAEDLSLKDTTRKTFYIRADKEVRPIKCIYRRAKPETFRMLLTKNMLVVTEHNSALLACAEQYPEQFNIYFIRRRAADSRWYLMCQIEEK